MEKIMLWPLVTVVVPIYNVENFLDRCIESIVNQTYTNLEIILIDDGSVDRCPAMCDRWALKDSRIRVVHKQNAGLGIARNTGIEAAKGNYIFFFDSDDYVDTSIVEKCVAHVEKHNADAVIYGRYDVYADGRTVEKPIKSSKEIFTSQEIKDELLPAMFTYDMGFGVSACGKMFRLDTIRQSGIRFISERGIISEDAYFALEFFSHISTAAILNESLYFYYKRDNSLSRVFRADRQKQNDIFLEKMLDYAEKQNLPRNIVTHLTARYHMYTVAAMKQLLVSDLSPKEKRTALKEIFGSAVLRTSVAFDVLAVHRPSLRIFFVLYKLRFYPLCEALLRFKSKD